MVFIGDLETTIHDTIDMDASRPGDQIRFDWYLENDTSPADWNEDALWKVATTESLGNQHGIYRFEIQPEYGNWSSHDNANSSHWLFEDGTDTYQIRPGWGVTFHGYVDKEAVIGYEQIGIYGTANNGDSNIGQIDVPVVPEPVTGGLLGAGLIATLVGKRIKDYVRRK